MQQFTDFQQVTLISPDAAIAADIHGGRAKCLQRLTRLDMPVPVTMALSFDAVQGIAAGRGPDMAVVMAPFEAAPLLSVRPSSLDPDWGGPGAILNVGMTDAKHAELSETLGEEIATALYLRFVQSYAVDVARLDPDVFETPDAPTRATLNAALAAYEDETDAAFPQDIAVQLAEVLRSRARAWQGTTARLLRQSRGAPADAGLGLVVQAMALGVGAGQCGSGVIQFIDAATGDAQVTGRWLGQSQGREALNEDAALYLTHDPRGPSFQDACPDAFALLVDYGTRIRTRLRDEMQIEFTVQDGALHILDAVRVPRAHRAAVAVAVALAEDGIISHDAAVMRVSPTAMSEVLHPQIAPGALRDRLVSGIAASPGAASGRIVLTAQDAQASAARGEPCVLVRRETSPEDIRGMHVSEAVVTVRGGVTSHAAVIGRGIGLPCVVGASGLIIDRKRGLISGIGGRSLSVGDMITVDGTTGEVLVGAAQTVAAAIDGPITTLLGWADAARDIGVRANADTPADAQMARTFAAEGIGLCRTEHMFFDGERVGLMREMIFADTAEGRRTVLDRLLPMQRADFAALFDIMIDLPVCIRLFDPPLHEFLPSDRAGLREVAEALSLPIAAVTARIEALTEYNPMLGLRGVRLGITVPEIYEMQARAMFEAAAQVTSRGKTVVPEIMIPLVSAMREVEIVKAQIDGVAAAVMAETGTDLSYRLGVMVETPRAALRAGDIAQHAAFLSFGTNDLTQMTYGLSRDDAGRFMQEYVRQGAFAEDPFHIMDIEGVGELVKIGAERGRAQRPDVTLSICGEHGASRAAIAFAREQGFDYVSCSPYRVPVARLSAAQLAIADRVDAVRMA